MFGGGGKLQTVINTAVLANGDSIAAYLVDASGNLLTSTLIGSKQSLNSVDASDYATDAASTAGDLASLGLAVRHDANTSIATVDGNYAPLQLDANGALKISGTFAVSFTAEHDQDSASVGGDSLIGVASVRQDTLVSDTSADGDYNWFKSTALGEIYVHDSASLAELVLIKGDTASIASSNTTIATNTGTISSSLSALSKAEDAAAVSGDQGIQSLAVRKDAQGSNVGSDGDYSSLLTWSEGSLKVVDIANGAMLQQQVSVTSTAAKVPSSPLANRKSILFQNVGSNPVWVGSATVTTSGATTGIQVPANSFIDLDIGPAVELWAVKNAAGGVNCNVLEMS